MTSPLQALAGHCGLPKTADAVVVGGGIIGLLASIELKQAHRSVVLIEAARVGCAQSRRHIGFIREQGRTSAETELMRLSQQMWSELADLVGPDLGWFRGGHLSLSCEDTNRANAPIGAWGDVAKRAGIPFEELSAAEITERHPWLSPRYTYAGFTPADAQLDPNLSLDALVHHARSMGVNVIERVAANSLVLRGDRVVGVSTGRGDISTPVVILATGAWTRRLLRHHGVTLPTHCGVATIAATKPVPPLTRHTVWEIGKLGFRQDQRGRLVFAFGGYARVHLRWEDILAGPRLLPTYLRSWRTIRLRITRDLWRDIWAVIRRHPLESLSWSEHPPNHAEVKQGLEQLALMVPSLRDHLTLDEAWSGVIDATADELPAIGDGGIRGLSFAAGLSGHGIGIAPAVARALTEIASTGETTVPDVAELSPERLRGYKPYPGRRRRARTVTKMTT
ncbi:MAG: FAD-binding oxidoreductase [Actinomycetota bacterium]|nr:FAD-binding oxidoreductase [Actinomycetota bacterium]